MPESLDDVFAALLEECQQVAPADLPGALSHYYTDLNVHRLRIFLVDIQQRELVALPENHGKPETADRLPIDDSFAGEAYRSVSPRIQESDTGPLTLWLPLLNGAERLGVLGLQLGSLDSAALSRCRALASLVSLLLLAKGASSDGFARLQRSYQMNLSAEMVWAFLPPRSIGSPLATSSAVLEPAYQMGGDAFDHSLINGGMHATILDGMGHDLTAGLTTSIALAGCRSARRNGGTLEDVVQAIDTNLHEALPDRHVTGILGHLELPTGRLSWANCGHPSPFLLRDKRVVPGALDREPDLPLGMGPDNPDSPRTIHTAQLEPGDLVLLYTDGVVDAPSPAGEPFGEQRFTDFILRALASGEPAPETLRRLIQAIMDYQQGALTDDATILLLEWNPLPSRKSYV